MFRWLFVLVVCSAMGCSTNPGRPAAEIPATPKVNSSGLAIPQPDASTNRDGMATAPFVKPDALIPPRWSDSRTTSQRKPLFPCLNQRAQELVLAFSRIPDSVESAGTRIGNWSEQHPVMGTALEATAVTCAGAIIIIGLLKSGGGGPDSN
jgi:hypothetical protein